MGELAVCIRRTGCSQLWKKLDLILLLLPEKNTGVAGRKKLNKCLLALLMYSGNVNTNDTKSEI